MKNLAEFRRALTVGSLWTTEHASDAPQNSRPVSKPKKVVHVQSNAICFEIPGVPYDGNPGRTGSWVYFDRPADKAKWWEFPDENTAIHYWLDSNTRERRTDNTRIIFRRA
jgi:hypothetical protein